MITITFELNGKQVRQLPTSWPEVTFKTFLKITDAGDDVSKILSALVDIDAKTLRAAKIYNLDTVLDVVSFLNNPAPQELPDKILGYSIPKDLGFETIGQLEDLKDEVSKFKKEKVKTVLSKYPLFCAIYACSAKHGEYDWKKAEAMADEFLEAPAQEVLAVGNFTLVKLTALKLGIAHKAQKPTIPPAKFWRVIRAWIARLGFTTRFFIWKARHLSPEKNS